MGKRAHYILHLFTPEPINKFVQLILPGYSETVRSKTVRE